MIDDEERVVRVAQLVGVTILKDLERAMPNPFRHKIPSLLCQFADKFKNIHRGQSGEILSIQKQAQEDFAGFINEYLTVSDWGAGRDLASRIEARITTLEKGSNRVL